MSRDITPVNGDDIDGGGLVLAQRELPWKSKDNNLPQSDPAQNSTTRYRNRG